MSLLRTCFSRLFLVQTNHSISHQYSKNGTLVQNGFNVNIKPLMKNIFHEVITTTQQKKYYMKLIAFSALLGGQNIIWILSILRVLEKHKGLSKSVNFLQNFEILQTRINYREYENEFHYFQMQKWISFRAQTVDKKSWI